MVRVRVGEVVLDARPLEAEGEVGTLTMPYGVVRHRSPFLLLPSSSAPTVLLHRAPAPRHVVDRQMHAFPAALEKEGSLGARQPEAESSLVLDGPLKGARCLVEEVDTDLVVVNLAL